VPRIDPSAQAETPPEEAKEIGEVSSNRPCECYSSLFVEELHLLSTLNESTTSNILASSKMWAEALACSSEANNSC